MKAEYRREMTRNYLVLEDEYGCSNENYQIQMLTRNRLPSFLECGIRNLDGKLFFYYDTKDMQPLSELFQNRPFRRQDMEALLRAAETAMKQAEEYLLDPAGVLLEPEHIFAAPGGDAYGFCYFPGRTVTFSGAFCALSEYLLDHLDYGEEEGVVLGYGIYKKAREEHACMEGLLALLSERSPFVNARPSCEDLSKKPDSLSSEEKEAGRKFSGNKDVQKPGIHGKNRTKKGIAGKAALGLSGVLLAGLYVFHRRGLLPEPGLEFSITQEEAAVFGAAAGLILLALACAGGYIYWKRKKERTKEKKFRQDTAGQIHWEEPGESSPTVLLDTKEQPPRKLLRMDTQEEIYLTGEVFQIGKTPGLTEYCMEEKAVSRLHAKLLKEGKEWCIQDLNSTNGTYVNGRRVKASEKLKLNQGDEILLADIPFLFL